MADGAGYVGRATKLAQGTLGDLSAVSVVSYFAGCGGLDIGFIGGFSFLGKSYPQSGFKVLAAYDSDPHAVAAYRANIGDHVRLADLATMLPAEAPKARILLGGFPCQEFSQCGPRKGLDSDRGSLYKAMVRYADEHRPDIVVGENVAGLKYLEGGKALKQIERDFLAIGYRLRTWEVRAQHFGVPQARHRLILIFVRKDLPIERLGNLVPDEKQVSAKDAIGDLLRPGRSRIPNQNQYFRAARAANGHGQGDERTPVNGPAYTVRANSRSRVQFHYSRPRRLTVRECARLQTFPDSYVFPFHATANMRLIGNAVPPVLAHRVAFQLSRFLNAMAAN